jgi:hypothetical protein
LLTFAFGFVGLCFIVGPFTEGFGDSLAGDIGVAVFSLLIALFFGFVTRRGIKEMQGHRTIDNV